MIFIPQVTIYNFVQIILLWSISRANCFSKVSIEPLGSSKSFITNLVCCFKSYSNGSVDQLIADWPLVFKMARFGLYFLLTAFFAFCSGFIIHDQNQASIGPGPGGLPLLVDTSEIMVGSNSWFWFFHSLINFFIGKT